MRVERAGFRGWLLLLLLTRHVRHPHAHRRVWRRRRRSLWKSSNSSRTPIASTIWAGKCLKASFCTPQPLHAHAHTMFLFLFIPFSSSSYLSLPLHMFLSHHCIICSTCPITSYPSLTPLHSPPPPLQLRSPWNWKNVVGARGGRRGCMRHVSRVTCHV